MHQRSYSVVVVVVVVELAQYPVSLKSTVVALLCGPGATVRIGASRLDPLTSVGMMDPAPKRWYLTAKDKVAVVSVRASRAEVIIRIARPTEIIALTS